MEELWNALRHADQASLASSILRHGVRSISDLSLKADTLIQAGVSSWRIEAVLASSNTQVVTFRPPDRPDLPVPFQGKRANLAAALEAALPNQRQKSLDLLDQDILARSTTPSQEARVRTFLAICKAWDLEPWPLSHQNLRAFAASLKAGGYRSAAVYFQAVCSHQQRVLHSPVDQMLRHTIRDCLRSILRGLGAQKLKDSFNGLKLADVPVSNDDSAFDLTNISHARDMAVIGLWYMLRESEMASAKLSHLSLHEGEIRLLIPIHKTDCPQVILLSVFDGIGTAALALKQLIGAPAAFFAWEIDPECILVTKARHPDVRHRGDFREDSPDKVVAAIRQVEGYGDMVIILTSAPPCPDFSQIRPEALGRLGPEGQKFTEFCKWAKELEGSLPNHTFLYLVENVILQDKGETDFFSDALQCRPIIADAADFGIISRPRLWWTRIDWHKLVFHPDSNQPLRWSKQRKLFRLHLDLPLHSPDDLDMDGLTLDPKVTSGVQLVPCLTTPAPSDAGRSAPKRMKGHLDPICKSRWLEDGRTFAPWQYADVALVHSPDGTATVPSPEIKEQFQMLPKGYTDVQGLEPRSRHRLLANGWHLGVAQFLFKLVLIAHCMGSGAHHIASPPSTSTIQWMAQQMHILPAHIGPGHSSLSPSCIPPAGDRWSHWHSSFGAQHPVARDPVVSPGFAQCLDFQDRWRHDLPRIRGLICEEVKNLIEDQQEDTQTWWKQLPPHIQQVYWHPDSRTITQIPILLSLLQQFGFPGWEELSEDLTHGFSIIGSLHRGSGWTSRSDDKYAYPLSLDRYKHLNRQYVLGRLRCPRVDPHHAGMLTELEEELRLGRMSGPFAAPSWWPCAAVPLPDHPLQPLQDEDISAAFCFSVCQSDKVRRCEDFRRSFLNQTVHVTDAPHHDDVGTFVHLIHEHAVRGLSAQVWAQDLDGAYRQFPLRDVATAYCILQLPQGPLLLRHHSLSFGAVASVWAFNRCADSLCFLARRLLQVCVGHFVDDFIGVESADMATSGFDTFSTLFRLLALNMKERKALPPSSSQKILGVQVTVRDHDVIIQPHAPRVQKLLTMMKEILTANQMSALEAQRLAGKMQFLASSLFGQLGRSALHPLYSRAHGLGSPTVDDSLNDTLRCSLHTLISLLQELKPRSVPLMCRTRPAVLYTDAFFQQGDRQISAGHAPIEGSWPRTRCHQFVNGWGFVCHLPHGEILFAAGRVPARVLKAFCTRRAFIYFLEVAAQLFALLALKDAWPCLIVAFIDNTAGLAGLLKGFGRDQCVNNLLAVIWRLISHYSWHLHFEWVSSTNNMSDLVSRFDFSDMHRLDAHEVHCDLTDLFEILIHVAHDSSYAHGRALNDILELHISSYTSFCPVRAVQHAGRLDISGCLDPCDVNANKAKRSSSSHCAD
eukprot:Skav223220  [mRNA]  locus=scaffold2231:82321:89075:+ [translate_table: standard]